MCGRACLRLAGYERVRGIRIRLGRVFGFVAGGLDLQISLVLVVFRGTGPWWRIAGKAAGPDRYVIAHVPAGTGCKQTGGKDHDEKAHHEISRCPKESPAHTRGAQLGVVPYNARTV